MKIFAVDHYISMMQNKMYDTLNHEQTPTDLSHSILLRTVRNTRIRLNAIPVILADVALETLKNPLRAIECLAACIINGVGALLGSTFKNKECTIKDSMQTLEGAFTYAFSTPISIAIAPVKLVYQLCVAMHNPAKTESVNYCPWMGNPGEEFIA